MNRDVLSNSVDRRSVLKSVGGAIGIATTGLSTSVSGRLPPHEDYKMGAYDSNRATSPGEWFHDTGPASELHMSAAVEWSLPKSMDILNGAKGVEFRVSTEAAATLINDRKSFRDDVSNAGVRITFPDNNVFANDSRYWVAAMDNYDKPGDGIEGAIPVVNYALGFVPYAGEIVGAVTTVNSMKDDGTTKRNTEAITRKWNFNNVKRINTWARFVAEVYPGEPYSIDIENWASVGGEETRTKQTLHIEG